MKKLIIILLVGLTSFSVTGQEVQKYNITGGGRTEMYVEEGEKVSIKASGRVTLGLLAGTGGPTGIQGFEIYNIVKDYPHGSLIATIGDNGAWYYIGNGKTITADKSGYLKLYVNDADSENNSGGFSVECKKLSNSGRDKIDSENYSIKWGFDTGTFHLETNPVSSDGMVFFGGGFHLHALDAETGKEKWKFKTEHHQYSNPVVSNRMVFFCSKDQYVYALDIYSGREKWRFKIADESFSDLAVSDGILVFGSRDGFIYGIDINAGALKWKFESKFSFGIPILVFDGTVFLATPMYDNTIYAIDLKTGKEKWKYEPDKGITSLNVANGILFYEDADQYLHAIDLLTQKERWAFKPLSAMWIEPKIKDGKIFYLAGNLYALNMNTGQELWRRSLADQNFTINIDIGTGLVATRERLMWIQSRVERNGNSQRFLGRDLVSVDQNTGKELWKIEGQGKAIYLLSEGDDNTIYLAVNNKLLALTIK